MLSRHFALHRDNSSLALKPATRSIPALLPTQILINVKAASLNYRDLLNIGDVDGAREGLIPLSDAAGVVAETGSAVTRWKIGDRVSPNFFPTWIGGAFSPSHLSIALGGGQTDGVLSDYVVIDQAAVVAIPDYLSFVEAATLPCAAVTAWHALFERGNLRAGETVLVQGTGGLAYLAYNSLSRTAPALLSHHRLMRSLVTQRPWAHGGRSTTKISPIGTKRRWP